MSQSDPGNTVATKGMDEVLAGLSNEGGVKGILNDTETDGGFVHRVQEISSELLDLEWSGWRPISAEEKRECPCVYLIREKSCSNEETSLTYIGETGYLNKRMSAVRSYLFSPEWRGTDASHIATRSMWVSRKRGSRFYYSFARLDGVNVNAPDVQRDRKGLKAALLTLHRQATQESPTANFGRLPERYWEVTGKRLDGAATNGESVAEPFSWEEVENVRSDSWLGLSWVGRETAQTGAQSVLYRVHSNGGRVEKLGIARSLDAVDAPTGANVSVAPVEAPTRAARSELLAEATGVYRLATGEAPPNLRHI